MRVSNRIISFLLALPMTFGPAADSAYQAISVNASYAQTYSTGSMDFDQAVEYLRSQMKMHNDYIELTLSGSFSSDEYAEGMAYYLIDKAVEETGDPLEADYIRYSIQEYHVAVWDVYPDQATMGFAFGYFTTSEQEDEAIAVMNGRLNEIDYENQSYYDTIKEIYTYVAGVSNYGNIEDPIQHSPYAAVINHESVCQGYALTLYYMLMQSGFTTRIVAGNGNGGAHVWNIVDLDGQYYYLDATWDSQGNSHVAYDYFLRGTEDFDDSHDYVHSYDLSFAGTGFTAPDWSVLIEQYPMAKTAYDPESAPTYLLGDADGNGLIDPADASLILTANADKDHTILNAQAADVNGDGLVDPVDASLVLNYNAYVSGGGEMSLPTYLNTL